MVGVDHFADGLVPAVNPAAVDGVLADEEEFFLLGVEAATDHCVVERFNVLAVLVSQETLVYHFFWQLLLVYQLVAPPLLRLQPVTAESVFVVQTHQHSLADELHVEDRALLLEPVHQFHAVLP
jgi:hypothetical protein